MIAVSHAATLSDGCLLRNAWVCGEYLSTRRGELTGATLEHLRLTAVSVVAGAVLAVPLTVLARAWRAGRLLVLTATTAIYTVPSLALFSLLLPFTGLSRTTVVIGLALYSLAILVRNLLAGLDAVPPEVADAAAGMGLSPAGTLWRVQLPLALPAAFAGLRIATVSTVALTTVGTVVGNGGLGDLLWDGLRSDFKAQVLAASVLCVLLAVVLDAALLAVQWALTPWRRGLR